MGRAGGGALLYNGYSLFGPDGGYGLKAFLELESR